MSVTVMGPKVPVPLLPEPGMGPCTSRAPVGGLAVTDADPGPMAAVAPRADTHALVLALRVLMPLRLVDGCSGPGCTGEHRPGWREVVSTSRTY